MRWEPVPRTAVVIVKVELLRVTKKKKKNQKYKELESVRERRVFQKKRNGSLGV